MNCNHKARTGYSIDGMFQSLIGILMNCNASLISGYRKHDGCIVSIPNRDFDELQLRVGHYILKVI